jgi:hypothetical protein
VAVHACNPSTGEVGVEGGGRGAPGPPGLCSETLSQNKHASHTTLLSHNANGSQKLAAE